MRNDARQLIADRLDHVMWPTYDDRGREGIRCSCGTRRQGAEWSDDVVFSDMRCSHTREYIVAYPQETPEQTVGGVVLRSAGAPTLLAIEGADLTWLLEQPDLPDEFRRAAAVHLESGS
jgi:hypothetical protein